VKKVKIIGQIVIALVLSAVGLVLWAVFKTTPDQNITLRAAFARPPAGQGVEFGVYRSEKYRFEFKYPTSWGSPIEKDGSISFGVATSDEWWGMKLGIRIAPQADGSLNQIITNLEAPQEGIKFVDIHRITIGGVGAIKYVEHRHGGFFADNIYVSHNGYAFNIFYGNRMEREWESTQTKTEVEKVLSSFKFTNSEPAYVVQQCEKGYEEFPITELYTGMPAAVDFDTYPEAREYRTKINEGASAGANFAGRHSFVSWGMGTGIRRSAIIDTESGQITSYGLEGGTAGQALYDPEGEEIYTFAFRKDSSLLLVPNGFSLEYYQFVDGELKFICQDDQLHYNYD